jgi:2-dehydro-3-deoxygluconokinase
VSGARRFDVTALGEPMLEFAEIPGHDPPRYLQGFGGDTANAVVAAARQGARTAYVTRLGADPSGDRFVELWTREGVATEGVARDPEAPTGVYFVHYGDAGHTFSYHRRGSAASRMRPDALPLDLIAASGVLHVSGISQAIGDSACDAVFAAVAHARAAGNRVAYDPNVRPALWPRDRARAIVLETVARCDVCLPSLEDATLLFGEQPPEAHADAFLARGAPLVVLKLGPDGALVADASGRARVPGFPVAALDATGAGDTFDGAFLARWSTGTEPHQAARYANAAAALSTLGRGAVAPIPDREAVVRFLEDAGRDGNGARHRR